MSCSFRSRKTGACARTRSTTAGPAATKSVRPTFTKATMPARRFARSSAPSGSATSAATISGFRDTVWKLDLAPQVGRREQPLARQDLADTFPHVDQGARVEEVGGPDLYGPRPGQHELNGVRGVHDASDPDDRHVGESLGYLVDTADGDRTDGSARQSAGHGTEPGAERLGVDRHPEQRVDQRQSMGSGPHAGLRH